MGRVKDPLVTGQHSVRVLTEVRSNHPAAKALQKLRPSWHLNPEVRTSSRMLHRKPDAQHRTSL